MDWILTSVLGGIFLLTVFFNLLLWKKLSLFSSKLSEVDSLMEKKDQEITQMRKNISSVSLEYSNHSIPNKEQSSVVSGYVKPNAAAAYEEQESRNDQTNSVILTSEGIKKESGDISFSAPDIKKESPDVTELNISEPITSLKTPDSIEKIKNKDMGKSAITAVSSGSKESNLETKSSDQDSPTNPESPESTPAPHDPLPSPGTKDSKIEEKAAKQTTPPKPEPVPNGLASMQIPTKAEPPSKTPSSANLAVPEIEESATPEIKSNLSNPKKAILDKKKASSKAKISSVPNSSVPSSKHNLTKENLSLEEKDLLAGYLKSNTSIPHNIPSKDEEMEEMEELPPMEESETLEQNSDFRELNLHDILSQSIRLDELKEVLLLAESDQPSGIRLNFDRVMILLEDHHQELKKLSQEALSRNIKLHAVKVPEDLKGELMARHPTIQLV